MLKRITLLLLTLTLVFGGLVTAHALDQEEVYTALQEELLRYLNGEEGAMPLDTLATQFNNLGRYKKSPLFGYYTSLLRDAEAGDTSRLELYTRLLRLDADFCAMLPESGFPTVDEVEAYALGREAQAAGDWPAAIAYYEESIEVLDSVTRVMDLLTAEPTATPTPAPTPTPTPAPVLRNHDVRIDDYKIDTYSDGTCVITDYTGNSEHISIPEYIWLYRVTAIGDEAFFHNKKLNTIVLPEGITTIGTRTFEGCENLTSITLPDSVTSIKENPFVGCIKLTDIIISSNHPVLEIVDGVLFDKTEHRLICYPNSLTATSYTIPHGTQIIGSHSFTRCNLTTINIPNSVTTFENSAFYSGYFRSINIPNSVTSFTKNPFVGCIYLTAVIVTPDHPVLEIIDGVLFDKTEHRLICYPNSLTATSYTIPHGTQAIGSYAFFGHFSAFEVTIPTSVTHIDSMAFWTNPGLTLRVPANSYAEQYFSGGYTPYTTY